MVLGWRQSSRFQNAAPYLASSSLFDHFFRISQFFGHSDSNLVFYEELSSWVTLLWWLAAQNESINELPEVFVRQKDSNYRAMARLAVMFYNQGCVSD